MESNLDYFQYIKKIEKLKNALENKSWKNDFLQLKISEITEILKKRGVCAADDLLDNNLIEKLDEIYFDEGNVNVNELFTQMFLSFYFKGKSSQKIREEFIPICNSNEKEREPTKREKLYDKIITLQYYDYNNYMDNLDNQKNNYINTFQSKFNEIKNFYSTMLKEGVDIDFYKYDKFDKDFFDNFIKLLNNIYQEITNNKKQNISKKVKIDNNLNLVKGIPLSQRTFFYNKEKLIYGEDMQIEYKNYSFPFTDIHKDEFKKQICGFLNSKGGRIFVGINDDKIVNGILLKYHDRDKNTNDIVNLTYDFYPKCRTYIDVSFIPIRNKDNKYIKNLYVIKIIVSQGETNQLYSYTSKGFNSYLRLKGQCINLTAEEIRNELFKREKNPEKKINSNEFKDPEPENPELINAAESLEKQFKNMNLNNPKITKISNNNNSQSNKKINNILDDENSEQEELMEFSDVEGEEEEDDEEEDNINTGVRGRGRGNRCGSNNRGNRGGNKNRGRRGNKQQKENIENNNINEYTIKINIISKNGKYPSLKELKKIFSEANNCRKKFMKDGKKVYGYLNFYTTEEAYLFIENFEKYINPLYEIRLIPKF